MEIIFFLIIAFYIISLVFKLIGNIIKKINKQIKLSFVTKIKKGIL